MKTIEAFQSVDGKIFTDEDAALSHDHDLIGEEIDNLLRLVLGLDVNRMALIRGFSAAMRDKRPLRASISKLYHLLEHSDY